MVSEVLHIKLSLLDLDPNKPAVGFDDKGIRSLVKNIKKHGFSQPISVRSNPNKAGRYIINFGERRYRAAQIIGIESLNAILRED